MKKYLLMSALLLSSIPAYATTYTVTNVIALSPENEGILDVPGQGPPPWSTLFELVTTSGKNFFTYCDDIGHNITIESGQNLVYKTGLVTSDGEGHSIDENVSNLMGTIARLGIEDYLKGDMLGSIAAQGAIWQLEYGVNVTSPNHTVELDMWKFLYNTYLTDAGYANGLISLSGTQSMILGSAEITPPQHPIPETSTWMMMILGFMGLTYFGYQSKRKMS